MPLLLMGEAKEQVAVAAGAGDGVGHCGKGSVERTVVLEALGQNCDLEELSLVPAGQNRACGRQALIGRQVTRIGSGQADGAWREEAQVGIVGQFAGPLSSSLGEVSFDQRLQAPGNAPDEPGFRTGTWRLAKQIGIAPA